MTYGSQTCPRCNIVVSRRRQIIPRFCPECGSQLAPPVSRGWPPTSPNQAVRHGQYPEPGTADGAIAALILGIISWVPMIGLIFGIAAVALGVTTRKRIRRSAGQLRGDGIATAGLALGAISSFVWIMVCLGTF